MRRVRRPPQVDEVDAGRGQGRAKVLESVAHLLPVARPAGKISDECPQQVGSSGERHLSLRLVADDAEHSRQRAAIRRLGQKPAFPAARVADDYGRCDLAGARRATDLVEYAELVYASHERAHVLKRRKS